MKKPLSQKTLEAWLIKNAGSRISVSTCDGAFVMDSSEILEFPEPNTQVIELHYPATHGDRTIDCQLALIDSRLCLNNSSFARLLLPVDPESIQQNQWFLALTKGKSKDWVELETVQNSLDKLMHFALPGKSREGLINLVNARVKDGLEDPSFAITSTSEQFKTTLEADLARIWEIIEWLFKNNTPCEECATEEAEPITVAEEISLAHLEVVSIEKPQTNLARLFVASLGNCALLGVVLDDADNPKGRVWYYWPHVWKSLEYETGGAGSRFTQLQEFSQDEGLLQLVQTIKKDDDAYDNILNAFNLNALELVSEGESLDFFPRNGIRLISVEGLIHLVMRMQSEKAKTFQAHVHKIVATVMQHGSYIDPEYRKLLKVDKPMKPPVSDEAKLMNGYVRTLRKEILALQHSPELLQRLPEAIQAFLDRLKGVDANSTYMEVSTEVHVQ